MKYVLVIDGDLVGPLEGNAQQARDMLKRIHGHSNLDYRFQMLETPEEYEKDYLVYLKAREVFSTPFPDA